MLYFEGTDYSSSRAPGVKKHPFQFLRAAGVEILSKGIGGSSVQASQIVCGSWEARW